MNNLNAILSGSQAIQVEARVPESHLLQIGVTLFVALALAITVSLIIANQITK